MGPPPPPADADALAAHAAAIRRLARSLVADDATADDVAQETMRVGLEHPPRAGFPPFAWLAGIARNVARGLRRTEHRRVARETAAARPDHAPATADAVARLEVRRRVVDAVLALAEPYRATVALRFFDGLPPRVIARRHGVPVETVRTRCKRGLELLRVELDRRHGGDRRAWMVAVAPLALGGAGLGSGLAAGLASLVGGSLVTTSSKVALGAVVAVLLVGGVWLGVRGTQGPAADVPPGAPGAVAADDAPPTLAGQRAAAAERASAGRAAPADAVRTISGRVLGPGGAPIAARVWVQPRDVPATTTGVPTTVTGADGAFAADAGDALEVRVAATADGFAPAATTARAGVPVTLRLRRDRVLRLRVVDDATRAPIAGAEVESIEVTDGCEHVARATTDAAGEADVRDPAGPFPAPFAPPRLRIRAAGYRPFTLTDAGSGMPRAIVPGRRVELALQRGPRLEVRVLRGDGVTPAPGVAVHGFTGDVMPVGIGATWRSLPRATIDLGPATSASDGTASIDAPPVDAPIWLVAEVEGALAVRCVREHPRVTGPFDLILRPTVTITGVVVDEAGTPLPGAVVQVEPRSVIAPRLDARDVTEPRIEPAFLDARWKQFAGPDGSFRVEGSVAADGSGEVGLWALAAGFQFGKASVARPSAGDPPPQRIVLKRKPALIWLRIRDRDGRPIVGAIVGRNRAFPVAVTGADGVAPCDPSMWPPDEPKVTLVVAAGFAVAWVTLDDAATDRPLDVVLDRARGLDLTVLDADGRPVVAEVVVGRGDVTARPAGGWSTRDDDPRWVARGHTDDDGTSRLEGLPEAAVTVLAREARVAANQATVVVAAGATEAVVRLPAPREDPEALASVEGDVVDAAGAPTSRFTVSLSNDAHNYAAVTSGSRFRFDDVVPGTYRLEARVGDSPVTVHRSLTLARGQRMTDLRLAPIAAASLRGRLRGGALATAGKLQAVAVRTDDESAGPRLSTAVDADGAFVLDDLAPGAFRVAVVVIAPTGTERPLRVVDGLFAIEEGATLERTFDVAPAARLWLRCDDDRFADGPAEFARERPTDGRGSPKYEATRWTYLVVRDADDRYVWSGWLFHGRHPVGAGVGPGRYRVTVNAQRMGAFDGWVDVPSAGDAELDIRLAPVEPR
ncbi:MAG: sigma-70 family RNA polymerase sigma factor [Planctomycetia bacterium]|nr:sigma-70 family RNA polymerase sigma factor [Planctomycetia bacterium]